MSKCDCKSCSEVYEKSITDAIELLREALKKETLTSYNFSKLLYDLDEYIKSYIFVCDNEKHHDMIKTLANWINYKESFDYNSMESVGDMNDFIETVKAKVKVNYKTLEELESLRKNNLKQKEDIINLLEEIHNGSDTHIRNEELKELKSSNIAYQNEIKSLVQDNNNLHTENCEMILAINDKDIQIEDLKNWVDGLKHNEETIKHKLTKEVNDLKQRVDGQCTTIRLKDEEIDNLKYNVKFSVEKRHNADRQYEDKYKAYDSKIKELDEKIVSLQNELTHERNYKEILIENMEKCFKGCKEQLHFLDLYKKNSLYYLEELNKFTTNNT